MKLIPADFPVHASFLAIQEHVSVNIPFGEPIHADSQKQRGEIFLPQGPDYQVVVRRFGCDWEQGEVGGKVPACVEADECRWSENTTFFDTEMTFC